MDETSTEHSQKITQQRWRMVNECETVCRHTAPNPHYFYIPHNTSNDCSANSEKLVMQGNC